MRSYISICIIKRLFPLLLMLVSLLGCNQYEDLSPILNTAEDLMMERPDSSLTIINSIDSLSLSRSSEATRGRYALLKSMAMDKNYIDTTTFDILQPAINFYINKRKGNSNDKLRTLYYRSQINIQRDCFDLALKELLECKDMKELVTDSVTLGLTYSSLANLYYWQNKVDEMIEYSLLSAHIFEKLGMTDKQVRRLCRALDGIYHLHNKERADSILQICKNLIIKAPDTNNSFIEKVIAYEITFGDNSQFYINYDSLMNATLSYTTKIQIANNFIENSNPDEALEIIKSIDPESIDIDSLRIFYIKANASQQKEQWNLSIDYWKRYYESVISQQTELAKGNLLLVENEYNNQKNHISKLKRINTILLYSIISLIFTGIIICLLSIRNRKLNKIRKEIEIKIHEKETSLELIQNNFNSLRIRHDNLLKLFSHTDTKNNLNREIATRIELFNRIIFLASLSKNNNHVGKSIIDEVLSNKQEYLNSTVQILKFLYPNLYAIVESHDLSEKELIYVTLLILGMKVKEIGVFLNDSRHYHISSKIREKILKGNSEENLATFLNRYMNNEEINQS